MNIAHNIYIHVPFCVKKCRYCAFYSRACANPDWDEYTNAIVAEIKHYADLLGKISVPTIFFGGGTPSLMPAKTFSTILDEIRQNFNLDTNAEISIEANPATMTQDKLSEFSRAGLNRLSVGVQSFDNDKLNFLGRVHNANDSMILLNAAINSGLRVSGDFIYGLPGENVTSVIQTCRRINDIGLAHCSMYELTIEENTPFAKMNLNMPSNETMADMYVAIGETLNLTRYEVSNYARPGQECRHNQNVWDGGAYIGIGDGAAGRVFLDGKWFEEMGGGKMFNQITDDTRAIEKIITGMRTTRGVQLDDTIKKNMNIKFAKSHPDMLRFNGTRLSATDKGMLVLDDLITELVK